MGEHAGGCGRSGTVINELYLRIVVPGLCIVSVVLGFTSAGYALDEMLKGLWT